MTGFVLSRIALAHFAHLRFDNSTINAGLQFLDRGHLREDLVGSLLHLHSQPPLFNLFLGLVVHAPLHLEAPILHAVYLAVGLGLALSLYAILRHVGVPTVVAVAVALVFTFSPSVFLYESWLHYDYPVTLGLCLAVLALLRYEERQRPRDGALFLVMLGAVVLTRSLFSVALVLLWAIVLVARRGGDRRRLVGALALPVIVVVAVQVHRLVVFGTPTLSSSLGVSLAKMTTFQLSEGERQELAARGEISRVSLVEPLSPADRYHGLIPTPRRTGVRALDEEVKGIYPSPPTDNEYFRTNTNATIFQEVSRRYTADALHVIRTRPGAYLQGVATATEIFFRPTGDFFTLVGNRDRVAALDRFYNRAVFGVVAGGKAPSVIPEARVQYRQGPARTAWVVVAAYALAFVWGAATLLRRARRRERDGGPVLTIAFLWLTTVYVFVVSNAVEVGENNRFRLYSDPLVIALLATLVVQWRRSRSPLARAQAARRASASASVTTVRTGGARECVPDAVTVAPPTPVGEGSRGGQ
ncbi:MAG: glycosyltransferase family 39 protein [Actinomycetota bacterium]|nr:glycosyltransferase family 39 protein [Actinomycetota bacterium]